VPLMGRLEMASKKKSESMLPTDTTPSLGSNYGLDGFEFYDEMNEGVLDGARLPETRGLSTLPGNLVEDKSPPEWGPSMSRVAEEATFTEGPNLDTFVASEGHVRLPDLSWLELAEQDPERLPKSCHSSGIPELIEAWGVDRRTNGLQPVRDNKDLAFVKKAEVASPKRKGKQALLEVVRRAGRESAAGLEWDTIVNNVKFQLREAGQEEISFVKPFLRQIQEEHGLAGKIFIRADFYPGYESGRWSKYLRKTASDSFYLIKRKDAPESIHDQGGRCGLLKKKIVASVPWEKALEIYQKKFASVGVKIPNSGDPKKDLRKAFRVKKASSKQTFFPTQPQQREASLEESRKALHNSPTKKREKVSSENLGLKKELKKLAAALGDLVASKAITKEEANSVYLSKKSPKAALKMAIDLARKPKTAQYKGHKVVEAPQSSVHDIQRKKQAKAVRQFLAQMVSDGLVDKRELTSFRESGLSENEVVKEATRIASRRSLKKASLLRACKHVEGLSQRGLLDEGHASSLIKGAKDAGSLIKKAAAAVLGQAKEYTGASFTETALDRGREVSNRNISRYATAAKDASLKKAHNSVTSLVKRGFLSSEEGKRILSSSKSPESIMGKVSAALGVSSREYSEPIYEAALSMRQDDIEVPTKGNKMLDYLHRSMNKGLYGSKLDEALKKKFSKVELKKERSLIESSRKKHEGLAGHVYIDALTYDDGLGAKGCVKGAEIHRGDGIKYLLGMKKCNGCIFKNQDGGCQRYSKIIVDSPPENALRYQREKLDGDAAIGENVISNLLSQEEIIRDDPASEFGLKNSNLNEFSFSSEREAGVEIGFGESLDDLDLFWSN